MTQYLYLVRHGEHRDAEHGVTDGPLSPRGRRQAALLAERIGGVPLTNVWHAPSTVATETAAIVRQRLPSLDPRPSALLFDCVPSGRTSEVPKAFASWFSSATPAEIEAGRAQMADAWAEFVAPSGQERHDLLITHNLVIAEFVRHAFDAPEWRWLGLTQAHCGLTVLRARSGRPVTVVAHNDLAHLPVELRTGLVEPLPL
ncbi:histidine phosphatase family protein [uncultured Amnibacterium sp.]|uniref:histidine phosphatase family protein n=1 Tax=uncultured Amnibacterium sp. TaxID=1631851 RepID=UPI0035CA45E4